MKIDLKVATKQAAMYGPRAQGRKCGRPDKLKIERAKDLILGFKTLALNLCHFIILMAQV